MTNSSNSSTGEVIVELSGEKKKQISPAKYWAFTLNNWTEKQYSSIVPKLDYLCDRWVIGKEVGDGVEEDRITGELIPKGTPHLQGYLEFKKKKRPVGAIGIKEIHFAIRYKNATGEDNYNYCSKDGDFECKGFPPPVITINRKDFYPWQEEMVKLFETPCPWDDRKIYWRHGNINIGKTQFCKWMIKHLDAVVIDGDKKHILSQVQNCPTCNIFIVLLAYGDEKVSYRALEQIKDGLFCATFGTDNNKMTIRNAPHLLIIGNEEPDRDDRHFHPTKYDVASIGGGDPQEEEITIRQGKKWVEVDDD